jgi:multiple sugar transport system ATP-binding protein
MAAGETLTLGIRPERLQADTAGGAGAVGASVLVSEHLGDTVFLYVQAPGGQGQLTVKAPPETPLRSGDATYLRFPAKHCHLFGPDDRALRRLI